MPHGRIECFILSLLYSRYLTWRESNLQKGDSTVKQQEKIKVAAYCRVSTDKEDQANSLVSQKQYFAEYICRHEDWELVEVYFDEGISGTQTKNRAGFNRMIDDAMHHEIDLILTKEVSRFARNTVDTLSSTRRLKEAGVGVLFTIDNIDSRDIDGEFRLTIMASLAQEESHKTSMRVKWGQKRRMEQGVVFGRDLMGYQVKNGELFINEEEVLVIKAIFHKYTNEGKGTHVISRELIEEGMKPMRVKNWTNTTILKILRNEKYVGDLCQKKTYTPDYLTHKKKYNKGEEDMVYIKNHHPAIISRDLWNRTQEELKRRSPPKEQKTKHSNRYWCSGKIVCGICGMKFVNRSRKLKGGGRYKAWRCYAYTKNGKQRVNSNGEVTGCNSRSINNNVLYQCMKFCIEKLQEEQADLKQEILQEISALQKADRQNNNAVRLQQEIDSLNQKKSKTIDLMIEGVISKADLKKQTSLYDEDIERLEKQLLKTARNRNGRTRNRQIHGMAEYISVLDDIMALKADNEILYKELLNSIVVYPDNTLIIWIKAVPAGFRLKYKTYGCLDEYKVEILEAELIREEQAENVEEIH